MNDQHDHGALGDAEYAEFMELAAEEGFDVEDVEGAIEEAATARSPFSPSSAARTSASRPW